MATTPKDTPRKSMVAGAKTAARTAAAKTPADAAKQAAAKKAAAKKAAAKNAAATKAAAKAPATAPGKPAAPKPAPKPAPVEVKVKHKLVRDSFTIPKTEYVDLESLKLRAADLKRPTKKSELIRAGIAVLKKMGDKEFLAAVSGVPSLKTGRPKLVEAKKA